MEGNLGQYCIVISENLPRRSGLAADAGPKGFEWRGIWANIVISEDLPRRTERPADAGERGGRRDPHV